MSEAIGGAPGPWVRLGFGSVALVDAALNVALFRVPRLGAAAQLQAFALAAGHIVALGLLAGALADAGHRSLPIRGRRWSPGLAALALAIPLGIANFADDFSVFEPWVRVALFAAAITPFPALVAMRPWLLRAPWRAALSGSVALALTVQNPLVLEAEYAGVHLATTVLGGLLAAIGLEGLLSKLGARLADRARGARTALFGAICVASATTLVAWPSNRVLVMLARIPTASVVTWLAQLRSLSDGASVADLSPDQARWFADRVGQGPIAPTQPPLSTRPPIVILVTIDALRADLVDDDEQEATENIRRIASMGVRFTFAHTTASATSPAIGSLFSGRYFSSLYWTKRTTGSGNVRHFLADDDSVGFPTLLGAQGIQTTCVVTARGFEPRFGLARGFTEYTGEAKLARQVGLRITGWLDEVGDGQGFLWAHLLDAHYPYNKGPKSGTEFERYLREVRDVDDHVGKIHQAITSRGLADRTFLVISADHGEAFGEHGKTQHGNMLYEEVAHIPLVVVGPGIEPARIHEPASLIDLGPTILDLFGVETPGHFLGQSLVPLLRGEATQLTRPIVMDTECGKQAMISRDKLKIIRDVKRRTTELYDLASDPLEQVNLADSNPDEAERRAALLGVFLKAHAHRRKGYRTPYR